jgi:hypothetical protein
MTTRAIVIAFILLLLLAPGAFYAEIAWPGAYQFSSGVPAMAPIVVLFLLSAAMSLPVLRRVGLSRRELLAVYCMVLVAAPVVSHGVLFWMIPKVVALYYQAQVRQEWIATVLPHIPLWFSPTEAGAITGVFEGQETVPWSLWWGPLSAWSGFLISVFVATLCLVVIMRKQWITNERLSFPLAQIPLEMVRERAAGKGEPVARLSFAWVFWLGLILSWAVNFVNSLAGKVPSIPSIPLGPVPIMRAQQVGPLAGLGEIDLVLWPWLIAIAYLVPKELSFSAWFFWFVRQGLTVLAVVTGGTGRVPDVYSTEFPAPFHQGGGAALALLIWALWIARHHLTQAARAIISPRARPADAEGPLPYHWAFVGLLVSFIFMLWFCRMAGCRPIFGLIVVSLIVSYYVMWARIRAETGIGFIPFPLEIQDGLVSVLGSRWFSPRELVTLISLRWSYFPGAGETAEVITGNALESYKIADTARINTRRLTYGVLAGFLVSLALGTYLILTGIYREGYFGLNMGATYSWPSWQTRNDGGRIFNFLTDVTDPDPNGIAAIGAGAVVAVTLGVMRLRFWWWPFHPVGYLAAHCWGMHVYYMPFMVGWACKVLVIRYGGLRLYRVTVPLAIGLIVGDQLNSALWAVVSLLTHGRV